MLEVFLFQQPGNSQVQETTDKVLSASENAQATVIEMANSFFAQLPVIGVGIVVFLIFLILAYIARRSIKIAAGKANFDPMLASLIARIGHGLVVILGLFIAATVIFPGINPGDLIAGLGIGSVALGFAFKDILQNLFSGFLILLYRPFKLGDQINVDDFEGIVEEISVRSTKIKTNDGERVVIPNSKLYMNSVLVRTAFPQRRTKIVVGIGYEDDIEKARGILMDILKNTEGVLPEPAPDVDVVELADSSVNLKLLYWTDSKQSAARHASDRVITATKKALDKAGIDMPFPHIVVESVKST